MTQITASKRESKQRKVQRSSEEHKAKTLKSVGRWGDDSVQRQVHTMKEMVDEIRKLIRDGEKAIDVVDGKRTLTFPISEVAVLPGNSKLGKKIWSVSLPPILYCGNCKVCKNLCYDLRHDVIQTSCRVYRCINAALLEEKGIEWFMDDVERQVVEKKIEFLRHNIGGDLRSLAQLNRIAMMASNHPNLHQLIFTKMYKLVNEYMDTAKHYVEVYELPKNVHLFFSAWPGVEMENPYNFPISFPVYTDEDAKTNEVVAEHMARMPKFYWHCGNDCTDCALCEKGCWKLGNGEAVGFPLH